MSTFNKASKTLIEKYKYKDIIDDIKENISTTSLDIIVVIQKINQGIQSAKVIKNLRLKEQLLFNSEELKSINKYIEILNVKYVKLQKIYKVTYIKEQFLEYLESSMSEITNKYLTKESETISSAKKKYKK